MAPRLNVRFGRLPIVNCWPRWPYEPLRSRTNRQFRKRPLETSSMKQAPQATLHPVNTSRKPRESVGRKATGLQRTAPG